MNKTIKKIVALGFSAAVVGATVGFAAATTLSDYPAPFVKNGVFEGKLVIGETAKTIDVIGATDIAASLQAASTVPVKGTGATEATVSEGVRIKTTGTEFKYGDSLADIKPSGLDDTELPTVLAEGKYKEAKGDTDNDVTYTQQLSFTDETGKLVFEADKDDPTDKLDTYLFFSDATNKPAYTYKLTFDDPVEFSDNVNADFEGTKLNIQGNDYTITDVAATGGAGAKAVTKITMMAGDSNRWLTQGDTVTVGTHTVSITTVNENEDKCGVKVDGTVAIVDVGDDHDFGDLTVGVLDAVASHAAGAGTAADSCELSIGSTEVVLEDNKEVKIGGQTVDGSDVQITSSANQLTEIQISYVPADKVYLSKGESYVDPVLGNFKFVFGGVKANTEEITLKTTSDDGKLTFTNNGDNEVEIPLVDNDANVFFGDEVVGTANYWVVQDGAGADGSVNGNMLLRSGASGDYCAYEDSTAAADLETACDNMKFLAVSAGGEARVFEITNLDATANTISLKDVTTGKTYDDKSYAGAAAINVGFTSVSFTEETGNYDGDGDGNDVRLRYTTGGLATATSTVKTSLDGQIDLGISGTDATVEFYGDKGTKALGDFKVTAAATTDNDMEVQENTAGTNTINLAFVAAQKNSDNELALDAANWGTIFELDTENKDALTVTYNEDQTDAEVFITPLAAKITSEAGASGVSVNPFTVGSAIFDSEATQLGTKPYIVVGGPCVNTVAAQLMNSGSDCAAGFSEGKAIIKLYSDKNALLVAGYSGKDTQGASRVLADYKNYKADFTGTELEVTTLSLSNLAVKKVQ